MNYMENCTRCGNFRKVVAEMTITKKDGDVLSMAEKQPLCEECLNELENKPLKK